MQIKHKNAHQIIKEHYGLNREPTHREVFAEIANIKRKEAKGNLDDRDEMLASLLSIHGHLN